MNYSEFIALVAQMRTAQKNYFKTRSKDVLIESKDLERQVDTAIVVEAMAKVTTEDIADIFKMHGETIPKPE
jgi:hypothetical protein